VFVSESFGRELFTIHKERQGRGVLKGSKADKFWVQGRGKGDTPEGKEAQLKELVLEKKGEEKRGTC